VLRANSMIVVPLDGIEPTYLGQQAGVGRNLGVKSRSSRVRDPCLRRGEVVVKKPTVTHPPVRMRLAFCGDSVATRLDRAHLVLVRHTDLIA
jgi:hypothetical protein